MCIYGSGQPYVCLKNTVMSLYSTMSARLGRLLDAVCLNRVIKGQHDVNFVSQLPILILTHTYTHKHTCTCIHTHNTHTNIHTHAHTHRHTHAYTCTCTHTKTHMHKHTHIQTQPHTHTHTHTQTHTRPRAHLERLLMRCAPKGRTRWGSWGQAARVQRRA